jgi:hypothetical protein
VWINRGFVLGVLQQKDMKKCTNQNSNPLLFSYTCCFFQAMPLIVELMQDTSMIVRDSAAWTVGRVCELLPDEAINPLYLNSLLDQMMKCLAAEPRVAANSCWVSTFKNNISQRPVIVEKRYHRDSMDIFFCLGIFLVGRSCFGKCKK